MANDELKEEKDKVGAGEDNQILQSSNILKQGSPDYQTKLISHIFDIIDKGDIEYLKQKVREMGISNLEELGAMVDVESQSQNALFISCIITNREQAFTMTKFLIEEAKCEANFKDCLNQTCLFYVSRDGRPDIVELLLAHGCEANHFDTYL